MSGVMSRMFSVPVKFLATLVTRLGPMMGIVPGSLGQHQALQQPPDKLVAPGGDQGDVSQDAAHQSG